MGTGILELIKRNQVRTVKGECIETATAYFVRYYIDECYSNGRRKTKCEKLADKSDLYRSKVDIKPLMDAVMARVNGSREIRPTGQMKLADYFEKHYMPWCEANRAAATSNGYRQLWAKYLEPHVGQIALVNLRTVQVTQLLDFHATHGLGKATISHIKFLLSGVYGYAIKTGVISTGKNPVSGPIKNQGAGLTVTIDAPKNQVRYSLSQVIAMLRILEPTDLRAAVAVALAFFTGLRPSEVRGLQWADYDGSHLHINRGVWRNVVGKTKTTASVKPVPVIEPLKSLLEKLRLISPDGFILQNSSGKPLSLDSINVRIIAPTLKKANIEWCGYYAARRGYSSLVAELSKNPLHSAALLRNSLAVNLQKYTEVSETAKNETALLVEAAALLEMKDETVQ